MEIIETQENKYTLLDLIGRLDTATYSVLEQKLTEIFASGMYHIVIGMEQLEYVSSSGLRVFLIALKKIKASDGKLHLFGLKTNVLEIFEISGFSSIFQIFPDKNSALAAL